MVTAQPGDLGVVAADTHQRVGAAWARLLSKADPGYGFVDDATPELAMGLRSAWRGRGIGHRLLDELIVAARQRGLPALSLSVERDNGARRLYERMGFPEIGESEPTTVPVPIADSFRPSRSARPCRVRDRRPWRAHESPAHPGGENRWHVLASPKRIFW